MKIRKATNEDFEEVYSLLKELWPRRRLNKIKLSGVYKKQLKEGKIFFLCEIKNKIVGMISLNSKLDIENNGKVGLIEEFIVLEDFRGKGLGKSLMNIALKEARKTGCVEVQLYSSFKRKKTHRFYKNLGFKNTAYLFWKEIK